MRFAYADPPYPGMAQRHYAAEAKADGRRAAEVNHHLLVAHLCDDYPDGWALSTSSPALCYVLGLCPDDVRVGAWVKPFAVFRPGVNPAYAWEPVIFRGGRKRDRSEDTVRDWACCVHLLGAGPPRRACVLLGTVLVAALVRRLVGKRTEEWMEVGRGL